MVVEPRKVAPRARRRFAWPRPPGSLGSWSFSRAPSRHRRRRRHSRLAPAVLVTNRPVIYGSSDGDIYLLDPQDGHVDSADLRDGAGHDAVLLARWLDVRVRSRHRAGQVRADDREGRRHDRAVDHAVEDPDCDSWSPDGTKLAVVDASPETLSIVNVDGSGSREIDIDIVPRMPSGDLTVVSSSSRACGPTAAWSSTACMSCASTAPCFRRSSRPSAVSGRPEPALSPDGTKSSTGRDGDQVPGGNSTLPTSTAARSGCSPSAGAARRRVLLPAVVARRQPDRLQRRAAAGVGTTSRSLRPTGATPWTSDPRCRGMPGVGCLFA